MHINIGTTKQGNIIKLDKRLRNFALNLDGTLFEENSKTIYISADDSSVLKLTFNTKKN